MVGRWCGANRQGDKVGNGARCEQRAFERGVSYELSLNANAEAGKSVALNVESQCRGEFATKLLSHAVKDRRNSFIMVWTYRAPMTAPKAASKDARPEGPIFGVAT